MSFSVLIWPIISLIAVLLGFLVARILYFQLEKNLRRKLKKEKRMQKVLEIKLEELELYTKSMERDKLKLASDNDELSTKNSLIRLKAGKKDADLVELQARYDKRMLDIEELKTQNELLHQQLIASQIFQNQLQKETQSFIQQNEILQHEIREANIQLQKIADQKKGAIENLKSMTSKYATLEKRWTQLSQKRDKLNIALNENTAERKELEKLNFEFYAVNKTLESQLSKLERKFIEHNKSLQDLSALEDKNEFLNEENLRIKNELSDIELTLNGYKSKNQKLNQLLKELQEEMEIFQLQLESNQENASEESIMNAQLSLKEALGKKIKLASEIEKDDLKKINGVGSFVEKKLNKLGLYTYEQISQLDDDLIDMVSRAIKFFPGKIHDDDWVGQASDLFKIKLSDPAEFQKKKPNTSGPIKKKTSKRNDLKIIEGIGPKIEKLLNNAGINTFVILAGTKIPSLKKILADGGNNFKMHNPQSWPKQASLAAEGEWEKLIELQDKLIEGKK